MNRVLSLVRSARTSSAPASRLNSDSMLAEFVALHEDMVEQLRLERLGTVGSTAFLTSLIDQHEKTAAMLRAKIEHRQATTEADALLSPPTEATRAETHYRGLYFSAASLATGQA
jgi:hypothetical protein